MRFALILMVVLLAGCSSRLTGYNIKTTIGQTQYEDGRSNLYTGASLDAHFDVK